MPSIQKRYNTADKLKITFRSLPKISNAPRRHEDHEGREINYPNPSCLRGESFLALLFVLRGDFSGVKHLIILIDKFQKRFVRIYLRVHGDPAEVEILREKVFVAAIGAVGHPV